MNKFESFVINKVMELLRGDYQKVSHILEDVQTSFNLIYYYEQEELFNQYSIEITNYYLENLQDEFKAVNIYDLVLIVIESIIFNNFDIEEE